MSHVRYVTALANYHFFIKASKRRVSWQDALVYILVTDSAEAMVGRPSHRTFRLTDFVFLRELLKTNQKRPLLTDSFDTDFAARSARRCQKQSHMGAQVDQLSTTTSQRPV